MSSLRKCSHDVYWPAGDAVALSCQQCNPTGAGLGDSPVLPRSSAVPMNIDKSDEMAACECGMIRTFSSDECVLCGKPYPVDNVSNRAQGMANPHAAGSCPACGCTVHYVGKKSTWVCADCDTTYTAPKVKKYE